MKNQLKQLCTGCIFNLLLLLSLTSNGLFAAANQHDGAGQVPHWGYAGSTGPAEWKNLSEEYVLCGSGRRQSPVDIWNEVPADLYTLQYKYQPIPLLVLNNGHTLQANYNTSGESENVDIGGKAYPVESEPVYNSTLMVGDIPYKLLQFHFHTPSEHGLYGQRYAMEVHLVHKSADGNLAVLGILLTEGRENPTLQKLLDHVSSDIGKVNSPQGVTINAADLLPTNRAVFHYIGSLTTPPCSENVNWYLMKTPVDVSDTQVKRFEKLIGKNARPVQQMHWRSIFTSE